jgi:type IV fimbrial biogenesis protein FimT
MKHRQSGKSTQLLGHGRRGFSLLELMFALTVLAILLSLAVPTFSEVIQNNRIIAQNNEFISGLNYARSEAIKRSGSVSVCASADGATCAGNTTWSTGWIVFADLNSDGALNGAEVVLQAGAATTDGIAITSPTLTSVRFTGAGRLPSAAAAGNFSLLKTGCTGLKARQIGVSATGRVSTTKVAC